VLPEPIIAASFCAVRDQADNARITLPAGTRQEKHVKFFM
jgi:hypothetical protein